MSPLAARLLAGVALAGVIAIIAKRGRLLSASGATAAAAIGAASTAAGWSWALLLVAFFITGTWLSHTGWSAKRARTGRIIEKGGPRDAWQVLANGGAFAALGVASVIWPSLMWSVPAAGAIAASTADTWATEIGMLSSQTPRSIVTLRAVPVGTSGGMTVAGTAAAFAGGMFIAVITFLLEWPESAACAAIAGGFAGSLLDSLAGATIQARRWCPQCRAATERKIHVCGTQTTPAGGFQWLDNDGVNAIGSLGGAVMGAVCLL